jgi:aminopeptidase N
MPAVSHVPQGDHTVVRFATTPRMSTYLLFLGVGRFDRLTKREGAVEIGIITRQGAAHQGEFILESTQAIVRRYSDYFEVPYPLPKLDEIAAPGSSQFFSAMENWGAIMSYEYAILLDPAIATQ